MSFGELGVGMFQKKIKKNFEELFRLHSEGKINPEVSDSFNLDNGAQAIAHLKDRKAKGKVIIKDLKLFLKKTLIVLFSLSIISCGGGSFFL